jgi:ketosteroid isomerase-like protein
MKVSNLIAGIIVVVALTTLCGIADAQGITSDSSVFSESDALKVAQEWAMFVSQADVAGLQKLLSDNYVHIHATGLVESKAQFIEALKNGSRKYDPIKLEDLSVRIFGSTAVVTGKFNLKAFARGKTIEGVNRFGLVLVKKQSGQQVASFQATAIPQQKENKTERTPNEK